MLMCINGGTCFRPSLYMPRNRNDKMTASGTDSLFTALVLN
jgi:hypothetical protein